MKAIKIILILLISFVSYTQEENSQDVDTDFVTTNVGLPSVDVNSPHS